MARRGRKVGSYTPGTLGGWLSRAKANESFWTEQEQRVADATAQRSGRAYTTKVYYALHPDTLAAFRVTRVTVTDDPRPGGAPVLEPEADALEPDLA